MDINISVCGTVGTEVDTTVGEGYQFVNFRLACTPRIKKGAEWVDGETSWLNVQTNGRMAENVAASVHKGDPVVVVGRLRNHVWQSDDGQRRERLMVEATSVGHDLARGRTVFTRSGERARADAEPGPQPGRKLGSQTESHADPHIEAQSHTQTDKGQESVGQGAPVEAVVAA